jgi:hypothetical protein
VLCVGSSACFGARRGIFFGGGMFFEVGDSEEEAERKRKRGNGMIPSLFLSPALSRLFRLAPEGIRHVDLADGGLGGQDGDLKKYF